MGPIHFGALEITKWIVRVNGEDNNLLKRAIKTMTSSWTSEDFINSTQQIDDKRVNEEARM